MDDLKKQAAELGIEIDGRWGEAKLREEIDKALAGTSQNGQDEVIRIETTPVRLKVDVWLGGGERTPAGTVIELPLDYAKQLLAEDKATRADPLPGE